MYGRRVWSIEAPENRKKRPTIICSQKGAQVILASVLVDFQLDGSDIVLNNLDSYLFRVLFDLEVVQWKSNDSEINAQRAHLCDVLTVLVIA